MKRRLRATLVPAAVAATAALSLTLALAGTAGAAGTTAGAGAQSVTATGTPPPGYYTGDYKISLNLYSFNDNENAYILGRQGAPPLNPIDAINWAKQQGFNAVFIPFYYVKGYENYAMPSLPTAQITAEVVKLKQTAAADHLAITGVGIGNNFANPIAADRALDVKRMEFWLREAKIIGAPLMRVFSGPVPTGVTLSNWASYSQSTIVPELKTVTAYAAKLGITMGLQNHGDMTATAAQTIQMMKWVGNPDMKLIDDTGYFQNFGAANGLGYPWYQDINAVLPYAADIDVKLKPADENTTVLMDFNTLCSGVRESPYQHYIDLERLWAKTDPDNPKHQSLAATETEVAQFLAQVKASLAATKSGPTN